MTLTFKRFALDKDSATVQHVQKAVNFESPTWSYVDMHTVALYTYIQTYEVSIRTDSYWRPVTDAVHGIGLTFSGGICGIRAN